MPILQRKVFDLWAKKDVRDGQELWLPLLAHLTDTMNVINWLYQHWLNDAQRGIIKGTFTDEQVEKLVKFVGFFHDFGKATPTFQVKQSYLHDDDLDNDIMERLLRDGFNNLSDFDGKSPDRRNSPHAMAGEALLESMGLNVSVGAIIGGHHGKPCNKHFQASDQINDNYTNYYQSEESNDRDTVKQWQDIYKSLSHYGLNKIGYDQLDDVPEITQQQAVILEGLLIMADWLASSEYLNDDENKPLFRLIPIDQTFDNIDEESRFENAIQTWLLNDTWDSQPVKNIDELFKKRFGFSPRPVQKQMVKIISGLDDPGMMIVESGCGTGKTEIALSAVEELADQTRNNGLFIGLPTQATTNAMFTRVEKWLKNIADEQGIQLGINLLHGKAKLNPELQSLPRASNIGGRSAVVVNSWFSGKKSILVEFNVATIDNLLMMGLQQRHLFLRHLGLSGKVVVIDEIHAYDSYMNSYLNMTLQWLGAYHVPVIALSATLPAEKRCSFLKSYVKGKYGRDAIRIHTSDVASDDYPLLTYLDGNELKQASDFPKSQSQAVKITRLGNDDDALVAKIKESIDGGGIAGVIVNTVKRAQKLSQQLSDIPVLLLHSAFLATDRSHLEEKLMKQIGKNGQRPDKLIVVGTQVLSQSLDIDFDVLFTDIAPIDLLIQRIGRLHRHQIKRPRKLQDPEVYVMCADTFGEYGSANESIYEKYYLMKTDYFLSNQIEIPDDLSPLVQQVYNPKTDELIEDIDGPRLQTKLKIKQKKQKAKGYQIDRPQPKETLHGWLDNERVGADKNDVIAQASVRDIQESIEVVLLQKTTEGIFLVDHSGRQKLDNLSDQEISEATVRLPHAVTFNIAKAIDELETETARNFPQWQDSIWLHDALVLLLNEKMEAIVQGHQVSYSPKIGLQH